MVVRFGLIWWPLLEIHLHLWSTFFFLTVYNVKVALDHCAVPVFILPAGTAINEASMGQAPTQITEAFISQTAHMGGGGGGGVGKDRQ